MANLKKMIYKAADKITNLSGGRDLAEYAGTKLAQRKNPEIKQTVTGKQALASGARVAGTMLSVAGLGMGAAKKIGQKAATSIKIPGQKRPMKVSHWMQNTKPGRIHGSRGNPVGKSGTSYKPYQ